MREMFRGDTHSFDVTARTPAGATINLTGAKAWITAKNAYPQLDSEATFKLTSDPDGGIVITEAVNGKLRVTIPPTKTATLADYATDLVYDVVVRDADGVVTTVEHDTLRVKPRATRELT